MSDYDPFSVCVDCTQYLVNGEAPDTDDWDFIAAKMTLGDFWLTHNSDTAPEYSTRPCDVCGSYTPGVRHEFEGQALDNNYSPVDAAPSDPTAEMLGYLQEIAFASRWTFHAVMAGLTPSAANSVLDAMNEEREVKQLHLDLYRMNRPEEDK